MKVKSILMALLALSGLLGLGACGGPKAEPIDYGEDMCDFCQMTIMDRQHAAEAVTQKGRVYKFDAIECMVDYVLEHESDTPFGILLVADYARPGEMIDAQTATYLISPNLPSPMGAFLSGFGSRAEAEKVQAEKGGELFDWEALKGKRSKR